MHPDPLPRLTDLVAREGAAARARAMLGEVGLLPAAAPG
jgi:hypothetical protein